MSNSNNLLAVFGLGTTEIIVIAVVLLILFGGSQLPKLAKGLGESLKHLRNATKDDNKT
jgi:sec-independent protein translocase protein TatA